MRADKLSGQPRTDGPDFRTDNTPPLGGVRPPSGSESEEYEVTWSQSLFRAGVVEGLSRIEYANGQTPLGAVVAAARQVPPDEQLRKNSLRSAYSPQTVHNGARLRDQLARSRTFGVEFAAHSFQGLSDSARLLQQLPLVGDADDLELSADSSEDVCHDGYVMNEQEAYRWLAMSRFSPPPRDGWTLPTSAAQPCMVGSEGGRPKVPHALGGDRWPG